MVVILLIGSFLVLPLGRAFASSKATITITVTIRHDTSPPKVNIYRPKNGDKISGNAVIIRATTQDTDILTINYQYRSSNSWVWKDIISTTDTGSIYSVSWDTTNLPDGDYDLRAVGIDKAGNKDPDPPFITVVVNHKSPDYSEDIVKKDKDNVIEKGDWTKVEIPKGALNSDTIIRISKPNPAELPPPKDNPIGLYLKIELGEWAKGIE